MSLATYLGLRLVLGGRYWWLALLNDFASVLFWPLPLITLTAIFWRWRWAMMGSLAAIMVGIWWFGPYFLPPTKSTASTSTLRVATFNVWGENQHLDEVQNWLLSVNADLVLLQEIPETYANDGLPDLLEHYPYQISQPTSERLWGNLLLSRYPILSHERLAGEDVPAQQRFTINIEGQAIAVYNVHLAMPIGSTMRLPLAPNNFPLRIALSYDTTARDAEIKKLLQLLENEPLPYVVAGDFNMSEQAVIYHDLARHMQDAFRTAGTGWGGSWPIRNVEALPAVIPPLLRLDYIWYSSQFQAIEAFRGPPLGSDHLPFFATLTWQTPSLNQ